MSGHLLGHLLDTLLTLFWQKWRSRRPNRVKTVVKTSVKTVDFLTFSVKPGFIAIVHSWRTFCINFINNLLNFDMWDVPLARSLPYEEMGMFRPEGGTFSISDHLAGPVSVDSPKGNRPYARPCRAWGRWPCEKFAGLVGPEGPGQRAKSPRRRGQ